MQTRSRTIAGKEEPISSCQTEEGVSSNADSEKSNSNKMQAQGRKSTSDEKNKSPNDDDFKKVNNDRMQAGGKKDTNKKEIIAVSQMKETTSSDNLIQAKVQKSKLSQCDEEIESISGEERTLSNTSLTLSTPAPIKLKSGKTKKKSKKTLSNKGTLSDDQEGDNSKKTCTSSTDDVNENDSTPTKRSKGDQVQETNRFEVVTEEYWDSLANNTVTQNTKKQTGWAVKLFKGII